MTPRLPDQPLSAPAAIRKDAELNFGERFEALLHRAGCKIVDVERLLGLGDAKLYRYFRGAKHVPMAWLQLLPPAAERLYLAERASAHGFELREVGDAEGTYNLHALIRESTDVLRQASASESDGFISPEDCDAEERELAELAEVIANRRAYLRSVRARRGLSVAK